jgi:endogenous inhibitor of DNA gyrase (YacG/DUF329 family)
MAERQSQRAEARAAAAAKRKTCAICGKPRDARYDPFCSKRCADVDLHKWLSGAYVVPGAPTTPDAPEGEED